MLQVRERPHYVAQIVHVALRDGGQKGVLQSYDRGFERRSCLRTHSKMRKRTSGLAIVVRHRDVVRERRKRSRDQGNLLWLQSFGAARSPLNYFEYLHRIVVVQVVTRV